MKHCEQKSTALGIELCSTMEPDETDVAGFTAFLNGYKAALFAERAAGEHFWGGIYHAYARL